MLRTADKKLILVLVGAGLALFIAGCGGGRAVGGGHPFVGESEREAARDLSGANPDRLDLGEDWAVRLPRHGQPSDRTPPETGPSSTWALVLGTFTEGDHAAAAQRMVHNLQLIAPEIHGALVHTTPNGSMVLYGEYTGRDDPQARADDEWIKTLTYRDQPIFTRVILTHIDFRLTHGELHPHDLLSARRRFPNVDPLYTLDIALWDDFESGELSTEEIRREAEAYAARLRAQGLEAYFYHDDAGLRSGVTVGLFDRRAVHPRSGLYSAEVMELLKRFPVRMVNGEELYELMDRHRPHLGTKPQQPRLVLVPSM